MDPTKIAEQISQSGALQNLSAPTQTALFLGALTLLPMALMTLTAFTRIIIVLGFVRQAVGTQQVPPNLVLIGLAMVMTFFVMGPTIDAIGKEAVTPYLDKKLSSKDAFCQGAAILQKFMLRQTRRQDLALFLHLAGIKDLKEPSQTPMHVLLPAFIISELKTGFVMGFCIYLPFLIIDLVVASVLVSMGMITLPPVVISAPIKLLLFTVADGWHLIARALSLSFG